MRVLVLDEGFASGAITALGLRRAGCTVDVLAATGGTGRCAATGGSWRLAPRIGDPRLLDVLDAHARAFDPDVIFPVTEPLQRLLWDWAPDWEGRIYPKVDAFERELFRDKRRMSALVSRAGVRVPRESSLFAACDVERAMDEVGCPIVIKGSVGRGGNATRICRTLRSARSAVRELTRRGCATFAQAYVAGDTYLAGGVFEGGRPLRFFSGVKTAQFPPRVGPAAELRSEQHSALFIAAKAVFRAARVSGIASIDLVRDALGEFHFLELNPRPWGSMEAARRAGVDLFGPLVALWRARTPEAQLDFHPHVRTPVFPLYLLAPSCWGSGMAFRAILPDARRALTLASSEPSFARHLVHRLARVCYNW